MALCLSACLWSLGPQEKNVPNEKSFFVRDGILSVADYNSTLMGVVVVVVVAIFTMG